jgi:hypothetical protein
VVIVDADSLARQVAVARNFKRKRFRANFWAAVYSLEIVKDGSVDADTLFDQSPAW